MDIMNRIIFKVNILVNILNYLKWRDIIINVFLKDYFYEVDVELEFVVVKFVV